MEKLLIYSSRAMICWCSLEYLFFKTSNYWNNLFLSYSNRNLSSFNPIISIFWESN